MIQYYHNPRCSKSRKGLELLKTEVSDPEIIDYLKNPISFNELLSTVKKIGIVPEELIRKNEAVYKEKFKGKSLSDEAWIQAMIDHPKLMERPILIINDKAVIGRPPEKIFDLIKSK